MPVGAAGKSFAIVVPLFIGAAPGSTDLTTTLRSLCETLRRKAVIDEEVAADPDELPIQLRTFLARAGATRTVVLFVDALNQLVPANRSHALNWLPFDVLHGPRLIVRTLQGDCYQALRKRPLSPIASRPVAHDAPTSGARPQQLAVRSKQLTDDQLGRLVDDGRRRTRGCRSTCRLRSRSCRSAAIADAVERRLNEFSRNRPRAVRRGPATPRIRPYRGRNRTAPRAASLCPVRELFESEIMDVLSTSDARFSRKVAAALSCARVLPAPDGRDESVGVD